MIGRGQLRVHRPDDVLGERSGHAGRADEHGRVQVRHDLGEPEGAVGGAPAVDRGRVLGVRLLVVVQVVHVAGEQTRTVEQVDASGRLLGAEPVLGHRQGDQVGDADSGGAGTEDHDLLVDQAAARDPYAGQDAGQPDGSGALDVVVERAQRVAVPGEDAARRRTGEVLPVQDRVREPLARAARRRCR